MADLCASVQETLLRNKASLAVAAHESFAGMASLVPAASVTFVDTASLAAAVAEAFADMASLALAAAYSRREDILYLGLSAVAAQMVGI